MNRQYWTLGVLFLIFVWTPSSEAKSNHYLPDEKNVNQSKRIFQGFEDQDIVTIEDYYESLCPACRLFISEYLIEVINRLPADRLNVKSYPYGNAKTIVHDDGTYEIKCQHGPKECYGNMLQACALDLVKDHTVALNFNACMMDDTKEFESNDARADECGRKLKIDSKAIEACAKGQKGQELHKYCGEQTEKIKKVTEFVGVPHVVVNGVKCEHNHKIFQVVCAAFRNPPYQCSYKYTI